MAADSTKPTSVLVIDDDPVMRELLPALLEAEGYAVTTAESADEAFGVLAGSKPGVVLTDLHMPGTEGAELVSRLHELCPAGSLLLGMSASEPADDVRAMLEGFLLKPFGVEEFQKAVASAGKLAAQADDVPVKEFQAGAANEPVLDEGVYQRLAAFLPTAQLRELYRLTLDDVGQRVETIRAAAARGDAATCRSEAHAMKGGCGMVGAAELKSLAAALEAGATVDTPALDDIISASERLRRMLDTLS